MFSYLKYLWNPWNWGHKVTVCTLLVRRRC